MNRDTPPQTLEIFKDKFDCNVLDIIECCVTGIAMWRIHDTLVWWLVLIPLSLVYIHLRLQPRSVVIDFQKKLAVYRYPKYWFFKKHNKNRRMKPWHRLC